MRARPILLTAGILVGSLISLFLKAHGSIKLVATNVPLPLATSGKRVVDLVRPTEPSGRTYHVSCSSSGVPMGAHVEVALASHGRTRILAVRQLRSSLPTAGPFGDVLLGRAALSIVSDGSWIDLGPVHDGPLEVRIDGLLPGPFGFEEPLEEPPASAIAVSVARMDEGRETGRPRGIRWRIVVPDPLAPDEVLARVFFFVGESPILLAAGVFALLLLFGGAAALERGRTFPAVVALVASVTLFHAVLLPPFQGADETSHAATIETIVFSGSPPQGRGSYPRSFSIATSALEQDRVQFQPSEALPLSDPASRSRVARVLAAPLSNEAREAGPGAPEASIQDADRRAPLFFRVYGFAAPLLKHLRFLDRVSAYRLLAVGWALILFAAGAALLQKARVSDQLAALYGVTALLPYSVGTTATCSNYAPAIGLGQFLAAAACAAILGSDSSARRLATLFFLAGAWSGVFVWPDFSFPALLGTFAILAAGLTRLGNRAGLAPGRSRLLSAFLTTALASLSFVVLVRAASESLLNVPVPRLLGAIGPRTGIFMVLLVGAPVAIALFVWRFVPRLAAMDDAKRTAGLKQVSMAFASLLACAFLLTHWESVPYQNVWLPFPRLVLAHVRAFVSNALAFDQDRLSWKFWVGAFGWHDAYYPDLVYAVLRWGFVAFLLALPVLASAFIGARPAVAGRLLIVSGVASGCGVMTFLLRYLAPAIPYGRFLLPILPLAVLPVIALVDAPGRGRWIRVVLILGVALQVWTAISVLGSRYAFGG